MGGVKPILEKISYLCTILFDVRELVEDNMRVASLKIIRKSNHKIIRKSGR